MELHGAMRSVLRRAWPSLAVAALLLLTAWFVGRACYFRPDVSFLAERSPARWILYPSPALTTTRAGVPLDTVFRRSFSLRSVPAAAPLGVRAFRTATMRLNGKPIPVPFAAGRWKEESRCDVAGFLRAGRNDLSVTVSNESGPPALWLAVSCPEMLLVSDKSWEASLVGATWLPAVLAAEPVPLSTMDQDGLAEQVLPCVEKIWPRWLIFAGVSGLILLVGCRWLAGGQARGPSRQETPSEPPAAQAIGVLRSFLDPPGPHGRWRGLTRVLFLLMAVFWAALFLHNSWYLPPDCGFDVRGQLEYINHFRTAWSVPLAGQGWQTHHPPLYHFVAGVLLRIVGEAANTPHGILAIRLLNLVLALGNIYAILACLRLIFPEHPRRWVLGLLVAGFLPMHVYHYQYPTNHILAGTLASLSIYCVLRILCVSGAGVRDYVFAGLALGLALLSVVSVGLLVVPMGVALAAKLYVDRTPLGRSRAALGMVLLAQVTFLVCGWYFLYVWTNLGTPLAANTGSGIGTPWPWWQDPGFRTGSDYLRFGQSLRSPIYSVWYSVWDGLYSTLWGDSVVGGTAVLGSRPPWSYDYMTAGMALALLPTAAILLGGVVALGRFLRQPTIVWTFLLGVAFSVALFVSYFPVLLPYFGPVKASYGLAGSVPLCVLAALGLDLLSGPWRWSRGLIFTFLGVWVCNVGATYWIPPAAPETQRYLSAQLARQGDVVEATRTLERSLADHPDDMSTRVSLTRLYAMGKLNSRARRLLELPSGGRDLCSRHYLEAVLAAEEGRRREAYDEFQAAMRLAPNDPGVACDYAAFVSAGPDVRVAIAAWRNALRIVPDANNYHAAIAQLYLKAGDAPSARRHQDYLRLLEQWHWKKEHPENLGSQNP